MSVECASLKQREELSRKLGLNSIACRVIPSPSPTSLLFHLSLFPSPPHPHHTHISLEAMICQNLVYIRTRVQKGVRNRGCYCIRNLRPSQKPLKVKSLSRVRLFAIPWTVA